MPSSAAKKAEPDHQELIVSEFPGAGLRFFAFAIDGIIIGILCALFFPISSLIERLGNWSWLPAFLVSCLYFALLEGSRFNGTSLGKRWLSMKIVTLKNKKVSTRTAALRAAFVFLPSYYGALGALLSANDSVYLIHLAFISVSLIGLTTFLFLHPQKRGLHDVLTGTLVVKESSKGHLGVENYSKKPSAISLILFAVCLLGFLKVKSTVNTSTEVSSLQSLRDRIAQETGFANPILTYRTAMSGSQPIYSLIVAVPVPSSTFSDSNAKQLVREKARLAIKDYAEKAHIQYINVNIVSKKYIGLFPVTINENDPSNNP